MEGGGVKETTLTSMPSLTEGEILERNGSAELHSPQDVLWEQADIYFPGEIIQFDTHTLWHATQEK